MYDVVAWFSGIGMAFTTWLFKWRIERNVPWNYMCVLQRYTRMSFSSTPLLEST